MKKITLILSLLLLVLVSNAQTGLDPTFGNGGILKLDTGACADILVQPDGKIIGIGGFGFGSASDLRAIITRRNPDGSPDLSFGNGTGFYESTRNWGSIKRGVLLPDGSIIGGGTDSNIENFLLFKVKSDGTPDNTFGSNGLVKTNISGPNSFNNTPSHFISALALQPDGKIIAAGTVDADLAIARYHSTGAIDSSFGQYGKTMISIGRFQTRANDVMLLPGGKILISGVSSDTGLNTTGAILVKLNTDGSPDMTFGVGGRVFSQVSGSIYYGTSAALQPDGRIVQGISCSNNVFVTRLNTNGSRDTSFGVSGLATLGRGYLWRIALLPDGRIIAGGDHINDGFSAYRIMPDGRADFSFGINGKITAIVPGLKRHTGYAMAIQPDGRILVGGYARFGTGSYLGGAFAMVRFTSNATVSVTGPGQMQAALLNIYPVPANDELRIRYMGNIPVSHTALYSIDGHCVFRGAQAAVIPTANLPVGYYTVQLTLEDGSHLSRKVLIAHP